MARASRARSASASSERSGQGSPSARRRKITRSRHCSALGSTAGGRGRARERRARAPSALGSSAGTGKRLLGERQRAEPPAAARPQRAEARSKASSSRVSIEAPADRLDLGEASSRRGGRMRAAAARPAISPIARRLRRRARSCGSSAAARPLASRNSPRLPARIGDAVGKGGGEQRANVPLPLAGEGSGVRGRAAWRRCAPDRCRRPPASSPARAEGELRPCARPAPAGARPRRVASGRGGRRPAGAQIDRVAAKAALGQHDGDLRRRPRVARRAAASMTMCASRGGRAGGRSPALVGDAAVARRARRARRAARAPR